MGGRRFVFVMFNLKMSEAEEIRDRLEGGASGASWKT